MDYKELYSMAQEKGCLAVLREQLGEHFYVRLPFCQRMLDVTVDELSLSVRSTNALKRAGIFNVDKLVDAVADDKLLVIRNLGYKSYVEIKTTLLTFGYSALNEKDKLQFWKDLDDVNSPENIAARQIFY